MAGRVIRITRGRREGKGKEPCNTCRQPVEEARVLRPACQADQAGGTVAAQAPLLVLSPLVLLAPPGQVRLTLGLFTPRTAPSDCLLHGGGERVARRAPAHMPGEEGEQAWGTAEGGEGREGYGGREGRRDGGREGPTVGQAVEAKSDDGGEDGGLEGGGGEVGGVGAVQGRLWEGREGRGGTHRWSWRRGRWSRRTPRGGRRRGAGRGGRGRAGAGGEGARAIG